MRRRDGKWVMKLSGACIASRRTGAARGERLRTLFEHIDWSG